MKWVRIALILIIAFALSSCVNVTTERKAESGSQPPGGGDEQCSGVTVDTYGWDFLAAGLHILFFPFKLACHALKILF
jgi:hypothetical protein